MIRDDSLRSGRKSYHPNGILQWHVTERCNLRCAHCYQEGAPAPELAFPDLLAVLAQFRELLDIWRSEAIGLPVNGQVNVTGGEPFIRSDFMDLLEVLSTSDDLSFAILTNGTFVDAPMAQRLGALKPAFVQVSVEGGRETHDRIRGKGTFDQAVSALRHMIQAGVRTFVSFTAHRENFRQFTQVAELGRRLGVFRVWADRLVPVGSGSALAEQTLTPPETREFFEIMLRARIDAASSAFHRTEIAMHRALQFMVAGERPYHCPAGDTLVTVQANGDLYPCRRMPIRVGNVMETPLAELYYASEVFAALRDRGRVSAGCEGCDYAPTCRGGAKCLSFAATGDPFRADPGCWLADRGASGQSHNPG